MNTLYCSECGSTSVQVKAWVDANTNEYCSEYEDDDNCWCDACKDHTSLRTLTQLWEDFSEIPVNNDDEIEQSFLQFEAGTSKFDVWHWFDERCPNGLAVDLMGETPQSKENEYDTK